MENEAEVEYEAVDDGEVELSEDDNEYDVYEEEEVVEVESKQVSNGGVVLSYAEKLALHKKKQAEKKEGS